MAARLSLVLSLLIVSGCAFLEPIDDGGREALLDQFKEGKAELNCGIPCAGLWGYHNDDANGLYDAGLWEELAVHVIRVRYNEDLAWFYIARAADEMGFTEAAEHYYRRSKAARSSQHRCDLLFKFECDGLDLDVLLDERLAHFDGIRNERRQQQARIAAEERERQARIEAEERDRRESVEAEIRYLEAQARSEELIQQAEARVAEQRRLAKSEAAERQRKSEAEAAERQRAAKVDAEQAKRVAKKATTRQDAKSTRTEQRPAVGATRPWYAGGTLHSSDMTTWMAATSKNRLATAVDFAIAALGEDRFASVGQVRPYANELVTCINGSFVKDAGFLKAHEVGAVCAVLMGWHN